jgi:glutathione S-transferase
LVIHLYGHLFSSFTWKPLIALYEKGLPFTFHSIDEPAGEAALARHWLPGKFPLLVHDDVAVPESSSIIEYLDALVPGPAPLIPADPAAAREARLIDRVFDNKVELQFQAIVGEYLPFITDTPDRKRIARAEAALEEAYRWLNARLAGRTWAAGDEFTLADCSAAPALFYGDWTRAIPAQYETLHALRARLLARPSVAGCVEDARPFRHYFPLGAPDRD